MLCYCGLMESFNEEKNYGNMLENNITSEEVFGRTKLSWLPYLFFAISLLMFVGVITVGILLNFGIIGSNNDEKLLNVKEVNSKSDNLEISRNKNGVDKNKPESDGNNENKKNETEINNLTESDIGSDIDNSEVELANTANQYLDDKFSVQEGCLKEQWKGKDIKILVLGSINPQGEISFNNWYTFDKMHDYPSGNNNLVFKYSDSEGQLLREIRSPDIVAMDSSDNESENSHFRFTLPYIKNARSISLYEDQKLIEQRRVSVCVPDIRWVEDPTNNTFSQGFRLMWVAGDGDSDKFEYLINYSVDNWESVEMIGITNENNIFWDISELKSGVYRVGVYATDGLNTGVIRSGDFRIN